MLTPVVEPFLSLPLKKRRKTKPDYDELVFLNKDMALWQKQLQKFFGNPEKPRRDKPNKAHAKLTKPWGGIRIGQTLFFRDTPEASFVAMLWPWKDKTHTTLKLACTPKAVETSDEEPAETV